MDIDWELDMNKVQDRWNEFDNGSQLVLKYPKDEVGLITTAPASGIWRMGTTRARSHSCANP